MMHMGRIVTMWQTITETRWWASLWKSAILDFLIFFTYRSKISSWFPPDMHYICHEEVETIEKKLSADSGLGQTSLHWLHDY